MPDHDQEPESGNKRRNLLLYNIVFLAVCAGILVFLLRAPEESTARLPHDSDHSRFFGIDKKEAEQYCEECHQPDGKAPLSPDHPPKYRCLFCHKRDQ